MSSYSLNNPSPLGELEGAFLRRVSLPKDFEAYTRQLFGEERWERYLSSFGEEPPVSVRYNPLKQRMLTEGDDDLQAASPVPWCRNAYYLSERPDFTLDPLFHAGLYYVQEASSMFLDEVLRQLSPLVPPPSSLVPRPSSLVPPPSSTSVPLLAASQRSCVPPCLLRLRSTATR